MVTNKENILAELNRQRKEIYTFEEISGAMGNASKSAVWSLVSRLTKEKRLIRLKRAVYLYVPEGYQDNWTASSFFIGANLVEPYAISFWSALNHWGLTEQLPRKTFIQTTRSIADYNRRVLDSEFQLVRLVKRKFFGNTQIWVANHQVTITDPEKTLADCLAFPQYAGGIIEAAKGLYNFYASNQSKNIVEYALKMGQPALKRLGYLLSVLGVSNKDELGRIKSLITNPNPVALEPLLESEQAERDSKWKIDANVSPQDLLSWKTK